MEQFCKYCGAKIVDASAIFCHECGAKLHVIESNSQHSLDQNTSKQTKSSPSVSWRRRPPNKWLGYLLCVGILLVLIVEIWFFQYNANSNTNSISLPTVEWKPYYKTLDLYSGYYCVDSKGTTYGAPPGYYYDEVETIQHEIYDGNGNMELSPKRQITVHKINQSAWVKFSDWPSCKLYGE